MVSILLLIYGQYTKMTKNYINVLFLKLLLLLPHVIYIVNVSVKDKFSYLNSICAFNQLARIGSI